MATINAPCFSLASRWWTLLYSGLTPLRASVTLLDPSESLQISLQIPIGEVDEDWDLWLEACNRQLSAPLGQWLESQGIEQTTLSRLTGADPAVRSLSRSATCSRWHIGCKAQSKPSKLWRCPKDHSWCSNWQDWEPTAEGADPVPT
jgi:hypothetical protein